MRACALTRACIVAAGCAEIEGVKVLGCARNRRERSGEEGWHHPGQCVTVHTRGIWILQCSRGGGYLACVCAVMFV